MEYTNDWQFRLIMPDNHPTWPGSNSFDLIKGDTGYSDKIQLFSCPQIEKRIADLEFALKELLDVCIEEFGNPNDGEAHESVGWIGPVDKGRPMPTTYGHLQRAQKALIG